MNERRYNFIIAALVALNIANWLGTCGGGKKRLGARA